MGEKETMSGEGLRESPTRASAGRESSAPSVSEVTAPRDAATGQSSGKTMAHDDWQTEDSVKLPRDVATGQSSGGVENIGSSGQGGVGVQDTSAAPNLGSSGQERSGMSAAQSNPIYRESGMSGSNPLYESGRDVATGQSSGRMENAGSSGWDGHASDGNDSAMSVTNSTIEDSDVAVRELDAQSQRGREGARDAYQSGRVATADVDGDGVLESTTINNSKSNNL